MANKIITKGRLAQAFLDNANQHIGMTTTNLDKIKESISKYWGYDFDDDKRSASYDKTTLSANGEFWKNDTCDVNMLDFWNYVYGVNVNDTSQIGEDNANVQIDFSGRKNLTLLPEKNVNVVGTYANFNNQWKNNKCEVKQSGNKRLNSFDVYAVNEEVHVGRWAYGSDDFLKNINYVFLDYNKSKKIKWIIKISVNMDANTVYGNCTLSIGGKQYTSTNGTFEFEETIENIASISNFVFEIATISYPILDISNCYIRTYTNGTAGELYLTGYTLPSTAALTQACFCDKIQDLENETGNIFYNITLTNNGTKIQFKEFLHITGTKYMWVNYDKIWYCFWVDIDSNSNITLIQNEFYILLNNREKKAKNVYIYRKNSPNGELKFAIDYSSLSESRAYNPEGFATDKASAKYFGDYFGVNDKTTDIIINKIWVLRAEGSPSNPPKTSFQYGNELSGDTVAITNGTALEYGRSNAFHLIPKDSSYIPDITALRKQIQKTGGKIYLTLTHTNQ